VFVSALKLDPALDLKTTDFPPRVVRFFEKVHQEAIASGTVKPAPKVAAKKSGGSGTTWLLVGGGVVAAGVGVAVLAGKKATNKPPVAGTIAATPGFTGIAAATQFTFAANGFSDPDRDVLTYSWDFGDGGTPGQGQNVTHVFGAERQYSVTVTANDGKGGQATSPAAPVAVKSLQATWRSTQGNVVRTWFIQQAGTTLSGTYTNTSCPGNGTLTGTVGNPRNVHLDAAISCYDHCLFDGVLDDAADNLSGNACGAQLTFTRQ